MRDPKERIEDILSAISAIERYRNRGAAALRQDEMLQVWFLWHLQLIGEAARALPESVRALGPDVPWSKIIGMRNILVHGYFEVDTDIVWNAVNNDIPMLKPAVERLLSRLRAPCHGS
jgi:uncharacterized protein with HEPN domain